MKKIHLNDNGVMKWVDNVWVNVSGVWKQKAIPFVRDNGVWKAAMQYIGKLYFYGEKDTPLIYSNEGPTSLAREEPDSTPTAERHITLLAYNRLDTASVRTSTLVDVSDYNTLKFLWEDRASADPTQSTQWRGIRIQFLDDSLRVAASSTVVPPKFPLSTFEVPVDNLFGSYVIQVVAYSNLNGERVLLEIYEMLLE